MGFLGMSGKTWKKVGKYALKAAPIVAAPFTGGASLLALGAGAGALSGALDGGGWKGALTGGALGAIPGGGVGGAAAGGVKLGAKQLATGLAKGAVTNFATGTGTGLATGQGLKSSLAGGGSSALSGFGTTGAGGVSQAAKNIGKGVALNVGGQAAGRGLQAAGVPGGLAAQGGNVFSNYLGNQFTSSPKSASAPAEDWNFMGGGGGQSQAPAAGAAKGVNWRGIAGGVATGVGSALASRGGGAQGGGASPAMNMNGGGTPVQWGGGGDTTQAPADPNAPRPASWSERYGPILAQVGGVAAGALIGRQATKNAAARSPEEQAALAGAQKGAGDLSRLGGQLAQQGQDYSRKPGEYFQTLLGGNRAAMNQAVAAPMASLTGTYRGAARNLDQQGIRGAARDVAASDLNRDRASKIAALTTGVQPYAAEQLAGMGRDSTSGAVAALGAGGNIYGNLLGAGYNNRVYSRKEGGDTAAAIGGLARDVGEVAFKRGSGPVKPAKPKPAKKPYAQDTANQPPAPVGTPGDFDPNKQYPRNAWYA